MFTFNLFSNAKTINKSTNNNHIDKSLFIAAILNNRSKIITLISSQTLGKTHNLSMLRDFLSNKQPTTNTFANLAINQHPEHMQQQNKHFVLYFDFDKLTVNDEYQMRQALWKQITHCIKKYKLLKNKTLSEDDKEVCQRLLDPSLMRGENDLNFKHGFRKLLRIIKKTAEDKKFYLLIDGIDNLIPQNTKTNNFSDPSIKFLRELFLQLKDNNDFHQAIFTARSKNCYRFLPSISPAMELDTHSGPIAKHFGFTEEEANELLQKNKMCIDTLTPAFMRKFYKQDTHEEISIPIYSPGEIANLIAHHDVDFTNEEMAQSVFAKKL